MRKKVFVLSILAAFLVILLPISAVVGIDNSKSNVEKRNIASPLFTNRVNNVLNKEAKNVNTNFLGKEKTLNLFFNQKTSFRSWIDKAVRLVNSKPDILYLVLYNLYNDPGFVNLLKKYEISKKSLEKEIVYVQSDPANMKEKVDKLVEMFDKQEIKIPQIEPPKPLGFSGQIGCVLTFFLVIFPIIMMIGGFLSALLAIIIPGTFLVPGCLEWVFQKVFEGIIEGLNLQGLTQP